MLVFILALINCVPIKIRLADSERYLRGSDGDSTIAHLTDYEKSDNYAYIWDDSENEYLWLRVSNHLEKGLGYSMENDALVLDHAEYVEDQKFRIMPLDPYTEEYWIMNNRKCLSWQESTFKFVLSECYENEKLQKFNIILQNFDFSSLQLLEEEEEEELHASLNEKDGLKPSHLNTTEKEKDITQSHMEDDASNLILNTYKFLYDLSLCFLEKGTCKKNGFKVDKNSFAYNSNKSFKSYSGFAASSSSKASSSSAASSSSKVSGSSAASRSASKAAIVASGKKSS